MIKEDSSKTIVQICLGSSCHLKGAYRIVEALKNRLGDTVDLRGSLCMGRCAEGINIKVGEEIIPNVSENNLESVIEYILKRAGVYDATDCK
ncbi:MAG: NAD(P)H-dependent oxidoreductase subunit E [Fervidobacterium sp.]|uniref:NAD(P)H-dependent oxidoreductase subunit E n=1 Tax=Fervidobacterium sp. TaxID=1871331 RepID=UPI00404A229B